MGRDRGEAGRFMDRLVVRDLGEDGVERSSTGVTYLLDTKEGRLHVLDEALGAFADVAPDVLLEPTEVVVHLLLELPNYIVHCFLPVRCAGGEGGMCRRRHRLRR
jgi:hypothetical protein